MNSSRQYPNFNPISITELKSTFLVDGVSCAATLHTPSDVEQKQYPAILMLGGWEVFNRP